MATPIKHIKNLAKYGRCWWVVLSKSMRFIRVRGCSTTLWSLFCPILEHYDPAHLQTHQELKKKLKRNTPVFIALLPALYSRSLTSASQGFAPKGMDTFSLFGLFLLEKTPSKCSTTCRENTFQKSIHLATQPYTHIPTSLGNKCVLKTFSLLQV